MTAYDLIPRLSADPGQDMATHLLVLYSIARFLPALKAVEIGADDGSSTLPLLIALGENGGHLWSVDPAPCEGAKIMAQASGYAKHWTFMQQKSEAVASMLPDDLDLVLIDGDHSAYGVRADWEHYEPKVRPGGIILFHDYQNRRDFPGIADLVDEIIRRAWYRWETCVLPYGWGLVCVRKRPDYMWFSDLTIDGCEHTRTRGTVCMPCWNDAKDRPDRPV